MNFDIPLLAEADFIEIDRDVAGSTASFGEWISPPEPEPERRRARSPKPNGSSLKSYKKMRDNLRALEVRAEAAEATNKRLGGSFGPQDSDAWMKGDESWRAASTFRERRMLYHRELRNRWRRKAAYLSSRIESIETENASLAGGEKLMRGRGGAPA